VRCFHLTMNRIAIDFTVLSTPEIKRVFRPIGDGGSQQQTFDLEFFMREYSNTKQAAEIMRASEGRSIALRHQQDTTALPYITTLCNGIETL